MTIDPTATIYLLAAIGGIVVLSQIARLAWHTFRRAALALYLYRRRYELEIAERLERYIP